MIVILVGLTLEEMTAQAVLFFVAGFETASSISSFCLYEVSLHPEIQVKMRAEIDQVLLKHNGKLSYEALQEMTYMEAVINGKFEVLSICTIKQNNFNLDIIPLIFRTIKTHTR